MDQPTLDSIGIQTNTSQERERHIRSYVGGQAVIEGVMMRTPLSMTVAVRREDGTILVRSRWAPIPHEAWLKWPFVRGISSLVDSLRLGGEAIRFSAEEWEKRLASLSTSAVLTWRVGKLSLWTWWKAFLITSFPFLLPNEEGNSSPLVSVSAANIAQTMHSMETERASSAKGSSGAASMLIVGILLLWVALPQMIAAGFNTALRLQVPLQSLAFQALTGGVKLSLLIGYLLFLRRVADVRRLFQYHGAEHKSIYTYEAGEPLKVQYARGKTTLHPRCGTTFMVMVVLVSVVVFTAVGGLLPRIHTGYALLDHFLFFLEKLPFLPLIVAITFEIQRLFVKLSAISWLRFVLFPGLLTQKMTTMEPEDDQLEVALVALREALLSDKKWSALGVEVTLYEASTLCTSA
ncbi:DUF1385 domain-containing protein [Pajaroellobacter abortibovis]|uniref:Metal-dependent enzyme n=1 Tax=Pajaroellobacter abortibovis TaxID=1882918 RepID=A0A1L6MVI9_9BACT|nr:DUF1385 domain-containing protein [Pajaroellobacter abortibovis]APR99563.1 hypothetical protein BCY86_01860 [Pajaroellobacter abortibovis]